MNIPLIRYSKIEKSIEELAIYRHYQISSFSEAEVTGKYSINYTSLTDTIGITHEANFKKSFALGAVPVTKWIMDKTSIVTMNDFIKL